MADEVDKLIKRLEIAASTFDDPNEIEGFDNRTVAAQEAIFAVALHLMALGIPRRLMKPLYYPVYNLMDKGSKKPLLDAINRAVAAAAVDIVKDAGDPIDVALRKVARASGNHMSVSSLRDFRKNVRSGRTKTDAIEMYRLASKFIPPQATKAEHAAFALDYVRESFQPSKKVV